MSANRRDELNLRHFHCSRDPNLSLHDDRDVHNLNDRGIDHLVNALHNDGHVDNLTSTNCSTTCGSRTKARIGISSRMILGTSITCWATGENVSKKWRTSAVCSTITYTRTSSFGRPSAVSMFCSMNPCLGHRRLTQTVWPPPCGVFVVQLEKQRILPRIYRLLAAL